VVGADLTVPADLALAVLAPVVVVVRGAAVPGGLVVRVSLGLVVPPLAVLAAQVSLAVQAGVAAAALAVHHGLVKSCRHSFRSG
jgi:hypothetical protein